MIYTFYMKYLESIRPGGIISDSKYISIIKEIDFDFNKFIPYPDESPLIFSCRSLIFDNAIKEFIEKYPNASVVSFGSGLDFRFERIDNGHIKWFDIDLPEVVKIRRMIFNESDRLKFIPTSALNYSWSNQIDSNSNIFFLAEGLFIYFSPDEVKDIILFLLNSYPNSMLLFDGCSTFYINKVKEGTPYKYLDKMQSMWKWSIDGIYDIEKYSPGISLINEWSTLEMFGNRTPEYLKNLLFFTDFPEYIKDQIIGMYKVYLIKLNLLDAKKSNSSNTIDELQNIIFNK